MPTVHDDKPAVMMMMPIYCLPHEQMFYDAAGLMSLDIFLTNSYACRHATPPANNNVGLVLTLGAFGRFVYFSRGVHADASDFAVGFEAPQYACRR